MTTPQTYELTTFSTVVVLLATLIFLWLLAKLVINIVQWIFSSNSTKKQKMDIGVNTEEETDEEEEEEVEEEEEEEETEEEEIPDLETKKES